MRRRTLIAGLVVTTAAAYAGHATWSYLTQQPGDGALGMVPANAEWVVSLDPTPGPTQLAAYARLTGALAREGYGEGVADILFKAMGDDVARLGPVADDHMTVTAVRDDGKTPETAIVIIARLKDTSTFDDLIKAGKQQWWKGTEYRLFAKSKSGVMRLGDQMVLSDKAWALHAIRRTSEKAIPNLLSDARFMSSRSQSERDANLAAFARVGLAGIDSPEWASATATLTEKGIQLQASGKVEAKDNRILALLSAQPALRPDLMQRLPAGAMALLASARPATFLEMATDNPEAAEGIEKQTQEEMGMSLKNDVMPALQGTLSCAAYPGTDGKGFEALMILDDTNGGNPVPAFEKLVRSLEQRIQKEDASAKFREPVTVGGLSGWKIASNFEEEFRKALSDAEVPVQPGALGKDKTLAYVTTGNTILMGTSLALLDRAAQTYRDTGASTLAQEPDMIGAKLATVSEDRALLMFHPGRLIDMVNQTADREKLGKEGADMLDEAKKVLGDNPGPPALRFATRKDGRMSLSVLIPMDVDRVVSFIKKASTSESKGK